MHLNIQATKKEIPVPMRVVLLDKVGGVRKYRDAYVTLLLVEWSVDVIHHAQLTGTHIQIDVGSRLLKGGVPLEKRLYANTFNRLPQNVAAWVVREAPVLAIELARSQGYFNVVPIDADGQAMDKHIEDGMLVDVTKTLSLMDRGENAPAEQKAPDAYIPAGEPIQIKGRKTALPRSGAGGSLVVYGKDGKPLLKKSPSKKSPSKKPGKKKSNTASRKAATAKAGGTKKAVTPKPPTRGGKKGQKISLQEAVTRINPDQVAVSSRK